NLAFIVVAMLAIMYVLSRLGDSVASLAMGVVSFAMFAIFMIFMATRVPSPDLIFFLVAAVAMAGYDFIWSRKKARGQ
ncbi:MAG: hypothetical protein AAF360_12750, partial [Pseudomonadota bacterium]